jgi:hypothetical protein
MAFAFCRYALRTKPDEMRHLVVASLRRHQRLYTSRRFQMNAFAANPAFEYKRGRLRIFVHDSQNRRVASADYLEASNAIQTNPKLTCFVQTRFVH